MERLTERTGRSDVARFLLWDRSQGMRAFTMVELLVVVMILGILLMLGIEFMPWLLSENTLTSTGREMASFIEEVRDEAVLSGRTVVVEYELGDSKGSAQLYRATYLSGDPSRDEDEEEEHGLNIVRDWTPIPERVRIEALLLGPDEEVTDGYYSFQMFPDGSTVSHGILLYAPELDVRGTVRVQGLMGEARFEMGRFSPDIVRDESF